MDSLLWTNAQNIFHDLVDLPRQEQLAQLALRCSGDDALSQQVSLMLEADRENSSALDRGLASMADALLDTDAPENWTHVEQVGPYRILRPLGQGGMGVVYLAERIDLGGLVAIKLLRDAWVSPTRRRRFALEQRTLAQLNHHSIAQLYDADALADGTPWFVMEYVDGVPLTTYWEDRRDRVESCIRLFRRVCEAVQYAHRRAIIHRDLKPSNILVNSEGAIKLLDFGIAKHIDEQQLPGDLTVNGLRPLTPAYAAPEQHIGAPVGVFTDVYALGVLLFQMLTGHLPFEEVSSLTPISEPRRIPFTALRQRFALPLTRTEWNDLSILCATALRYEPERRYPSVEAMMRDIDAFLEHRPLEARADSLLYKLRKFIVRRRVQLAYGLSFAVILAAFAGYFAYRLSIARDQALAEAARTERIQQFTTNLFRGNESSVAPADDLKVKTLLDRGREEAMNLNSDPDMQADMQQTLGDIYRKLGDQHEAESLLTHALAWRSSQQKQYPAKYAQALLELSELRTDQARLDEAEQLAQHALQISRTLAPSQEDKANPVALHAMVSLGTVLESKGDYPHAAALLESAIQMRGKRPPDANMALNLRELANVYFYQGHYIVADTLNRQVLAVHRLLYGARHPEIAEDLNNLGAVQLELGNLGLAEELYRQSLAVTEAWYGPHHPKTAEDLTSLARTLVRERKMRDARSMLERALAIQQAAHGHDHLAVASALNELASIENQQEDFSHAEQHFTEALEIWRHTYGQTHQFIGVGLSNLGSVYMAEKDFRHAEQMYREALAVFITTVHEEHLNTAIGHIKLGRSLLRQRRFSEAEEETLKGYNTLVKTVAPGNNFLKAAKGDLVQIYIGLNRPQQADRFR